MQVTTSWAMSITGADRIKFNEAVSKGHYPCAPQTRAGARREFDMADMVGLFAFARMTELGLLPRHAGSLACQAADIVRQDSDAQSVFIARALSGETWILPYYGEGKDKGRVCFNPGGKGYSVAVEVNIANVKQAVTDGVHRLSAIQAAANG